MPPLQASWGGYVFAINIVGIHAGAVLFLHYFSRFNNWDTSKEPVQIGR